MFDPEVTRPTAAEIVSELSIHGATATVNAGRLTIDSPSGPVPAWLKDAIGETWQAIIEYLQPSNDWPVMAAAFVSQLTLDRLPLDVDAYGPGVVAVVDRAKYLAWLQADVKLGPRSPRARYGALQAELRHWQHALTGLAPQPPQTVTQMLEELF